MADPGQLAQQLLQKHFPKFGSIRVLCTFTSVGDAEYNATTGGVVESVIGSQPVYIIFGEFTFSDTKAPTYKEDDSVIESTDKKAIFPQLDLSFIPKINDYITDNVKKWRVVGVSVDPANAHYELHVRPIDG